MTAINLGATGVNVGPVDITSGTQAILFEVDKGIPTPTVGLENPSDPTSNLVVDLSDEGKEYELISSNVPTTNPSNVTANYDTHATTSIVSATLNNSDIKGPLTRTDEKIFRHKPSELNSGTHTAAVTAKDSVGKQKSFSASFTLSN